MDFRRHSRLIVLVSCMLLAAALWLQQVNPYLNPADDSGRYMVLGESLAKTGDLRLLNDTRQLRDTLYVPGFPAMIAFWILATGRDPGGVVVLVKFTLLLFLLGSIPMFALLLKRARLDPTLEVCCLLCYALCPALIAYANEVMSEMPLLFFCLTAIVLAEAGTAPPDDEAEDARRSEGRYPPAPAHVPVWRRVAALGCAALSYTVRAAGIVLLLSLLFWFWKRYGAKWGISAAAVTLLVVGAWQLRNSAIIAHDPPNTHDTYLRQFTLRDPDSPSAGRIQLNIIGLLGRVRRGFPAYIGNIPRAVLYIMAPANSPWLVVFYTIAVPFTLLTLYGGLVAWRRGLMLTVGFSALFWLFVAMWPWRNPRFLVPIIPLILLFVFLGAEEFCAHMRRRFGQGPVRALQTVSFALLLIYYFRVFLVVAPREHAPVLSGYALGRTRDEAGFYAACDWLRAKDPATVVMGRPAYLLHLYSGHPTTQVEPSDSPRVQELAYVLPNHVRYILLDKWTWAKTENYLGPYLREYREYWIMDWQDPRGSGVRIFRRKDVPGISAGITSIAHVHPGQFRACR